MKIDRIAKPIAGAADIWNLKGGVSYHVRVPSTGEPWFVVKISNDCGFDSIEPLEVPVGWDDSYEYVRGDAHIWPRLTRLAHDADLANADLEFTLVPVVDEELATGSYALLYRFSWPS